MYPLQPDIPHTSASGYEGDIVYGTMKSYGMQELTREDGESGSFYIEDWESNISDAFEELCD